MMSRHPTWLRADPQSLRPGSIFDASAVNTRELVLSDSGARSNGGQAQTLLIHKLLHQQWLHASRHLFRSTLGERAKLNGYQRQVPGARPGPWNPRPFTSIWAATATFRASGGAPQAILRPEQPQTPRGQCEDSQQSSKSGLQAPGCWGRPCQLTCGPKRQPRLSAGTPRLRQGRTHTHPLKRLSFC